MGRHLFILTEALLCLLFPQGQPHSAKNEQTPDKQNKEVRPGVISRGKLAGEMTVFGENLFGDPDGLLT